MRALCALLLATASSFGGWLFERPDSPNLTPEGLALIVNYEVGGKADYLRWPRPEWPKGRSGVTQGIGYDNGYATRARIEADWQAIAQVRRLGATAGITGSRAGELAKQVRDIIVHWDVALDVFQRVDIGRYREQAQRAFPGFDELKPSAQDALISLVYNRGPSMMGPNRVEMRQMRDLYVPRKDYAGLSSAFRRMIRVWVGTEIYGGMKSRREAEARLCLR